MNYLRIRGYAKGPISPISCQELNNTLLFHKFSGLKEMIFPMMWSSLETDGINDMENPKIIERLIDMNI